MAKNSESKLFAFLGVLLNAFFIPVGFIIVLLIRKNDVYSMYYAKQGLAVWIAGLISAAISMIPILGWIVAPILGFVVLVLWIIALINSLSGDMKETPIVGKYAKKIKF